MILCYTNRGWSLKPNVSRPFPLNATILHHLTSTDIPKQFAESVLKSLDVDDFVGGDDYDELVFDMHDNLKNSFKSGGFNMPKWVSNSVLVLERIEESESEALRVNDAPAQSSEEL